MDSIEDGIRIEEEDEEADDEMPSLVPDVAKMLVMDAGGICLEFDEMPSLVPDVAKMWVMDAGGICLEFDQTVATSRYRRGDEARPSHVLRVMAVGFSTLFNVQK